MTDGPVNPIRSHDIRAESGVGQLAAHAVSEIASRRMRSKTRLSERLLSQLIEAVCDPASVEAKSVQLDMMRSGVRAEDIQDHYIPEAARRLGQSWVDDNLSFSDVTIATARLQRMLHDLPVQRLDHKHVSSEASTVLVIVASDENHTLGAMILSEQLRRVGISVQLALGQGPSSLANDVARGDYDAIFISISATDRLAGIKTLVSRIKSDVPKQPPIVVGGSVVRYGQDIKTITSADHITNDPIEAIRLCGLKIFQPGARLGATVE